MKLVNVEYTFDNSKILFYFTADGRVDFRELVKDLASVFRTRIELRQIGVRDEAKMLGGLGICGRPFCCSSFLSGFQPVSIKMAKEQGLSLNPVKISGTCGRLMCCLKYEQEAYADLLRRTPAVNSIVMTPAGKGVVVDQNIITGNLQVRLDSAPEAAPQTFHVKQVKLLRGKGAAEKKEVEAELEVTEEVVVLEAVLDPVEEKLEKPERKERPVEKRPQREANSGERREQPPKDREKRPPQQGGKGSERRERPPKREGRPPPRGQGEHAKQAGEGRPPRQERSGNERSGGAPRGARPGGTRPPQQPAAGTPGGREPEGPSSGACSKCAGRCGATAGNIRIKRWAALCICKAALIFIGLERMGNVYFVVFQARNAPAGRGGKTQSAVFPKARCFRDGIRRKTAVPSCLSNENFPRHPRNCCFFGIL